MPLTPEPSAPSSGVTDATSTSSPRDWSTAVIHSGVISASPPGTATSTIYPPPEMSPGHVSNPNALACLQPVRPELVSNPNALASLQPDCPSLPPTRSP